MKQLEGEVEIVTGGAAGFGEGIVRLYVAEGARVVIADLDVTRGEALAAELGASAVFQRCDVSSGADVGALVAAWAARFGTPDVVVNNAGTTHANQPMLEVDLLSKSMAVELGPDGIRVNAICPVMGETGLLGKFMGVPDTPENRARFISTIPLGRLCKASDVAAAALFLSSDAAEFIRRPARDMTLLQRGGGACLVRRSTDSACAYIRYDSASMTLRGSP